MIEAFILFLILLVVVVGVGLLILWAITRFMPEVATPARYVVGVIVILILLYALLRLVQRGIPGLP